MTTAAAKRLKRLHIETQTPLPLPLPEPTAVTNPEHTHQQFLNLTTQNQPNPSTDPWQTSPFKWIKTQPPVTRARTLKHLLIQWALKHNAPIHPTPKNKHSDYLHSPTNTPIKIHTSTQWDSGEYRFQNIHPTPNHYLALFGLTPTHPHLWLLPAHLAKPHLENIKWLTLNPQTPPNWLTPYGGDLTTATNLLTAKTLPAGPTLQT